MPSRPLAGKVAITGGVTAHLSGEWLDTSVAFSVGVIRLGRRRCLVQELSAVELLAWVDTLFLDWPAEQVEPFSDRSAATLTLFLVAFSALAPRRATLRRLAAEPAGRYGRLSRA
jgi:hypothetical protein